MIVGVGTTNRKKKCFWKISIRPSEAQAPTNQPIFSVRNTLETIVIDWQPWDVSGHFEPTFITQKCIIFYVPFHWLASNSCLK